MTKWNETTKLMRCLSCDTVTDWGDEDECPNCGHIEGMMEEPDAPEDRIIAREGDATGQRDLALSDARRKSRATAP